jgi:hypothetical protein
LRAAARVTWFLTGLVWAARSLIGLAHPDYWNAVTTLDYTAVWSSSLAWILLGLSVAFIGRLVATRVVLRIATVVAIGAMVAGVANGIEDGLGHRQWGTVYVIGSLTGFLGLLVLAAVIARAGLPRLAVAVVAMFLGIALTATENVFAVAAAVIVLLVFGALAASPEWFRSDRTAEVPA